MRISSFGYLVKQGAGNVWVNRMMSLASVGVLTTCLLLIGASLLVSFNINRIIQYIGDQNEIVCFIHDDADEELVRATENALRSDDRLFDVVFIDKEAALREFMTELPEDATPLLEGLGDDNPCPASFRMKVKNIGQTVEVVDYLRESEICEKVNAPTDVADTMTNIQKMVNVFSMALLIAFGVISLVIISNTIHAAVHSRSREINVMRYVGATGSFIRLPFFIEGMLLGLIAALIAFGLTWLCYWAVFDYLETNASTWISQLLGSLVPFEEVIWKLLIGYCAAGVVVGSIGCTFSVRSYLKV